MFVHVEVLTGRYVCVQMEVFETIYGNQLRSISIFESAPDYVIRRLSALCEQQVYLPGKNLAVIVTSTLSPSLPLSPRQ